MSFCCECCVLSGRGLCDELITRPEESYRVWCVFCVIQKPQELGGVGPQRHKKKILAEKEIVAWVEVNIVIESGRAMEWKLMWKN
jgi:hypothetical protein